MTPQEMERLFREANRISPSSAEDHFTLQVMRHLPHSAPSWLAPLWIAFCVLCGTILAAALGAFAGLGALLHTLYSSFLLLVHTYSRLLSSIPLPSVSFSIEPIPLLGIGLSLILGSYLAFRKSLQQEL